MAETTIARRQRFLNLSAMGAAAKRKHQLCDSHEYRVWSGIKQRCENPKYKHYGNYGGRGIRMCERWHDFRNFLKDMGRRPSPWHTIERKNNDGDYEPGNCEWATRKTNQRNRRNTLFIEIDGVRRPVTEWSEISGISDNVIRARLRLGWDSQRAVFEKVQRHGGQIPGSAIRSRLAR